MQVSMRMPWTWPVLMEAPTESIFKEEVACWGYTTLRVPQQQQHLLKRCCNCNGTGEWAGASCTRSPALRRPDLHPFSLLMDY
ncbi:MAG: hypothetical protein HC767_03550 [Akkermansiaceae bacterium]|nr:hypothetical protein [Akkermansiaceae bacterium]